MQGQKSYYFVAIKWNLIDYILWKNLIGSCAHYNLIWDIAEY